MVNVETYGPGYYFKGDVQDVEIKDLLDGDGESMGITVFVNCLTKKDTPTSYGAPHWVKVDGKLIPLKAIKEPMEELPYGFGTHQISREP